MDFLRYYNELVQKVDTFSADTVQKYKDHIVCRHGCTECCRYDLTLLPLEYYILQRHFAELQGSKRSGDPDLKDLSATDSCPLLHEGGCLLYSSRPIICRTHGLPLLLHEQSKEIRDCCPKNFSGLSLEEIPDTDLLQLETLNTILIALNSAFCDQKHINPAKRIPISDLFSASPGI